MKINGENSETGEKYQSDAGSVTGDFIKTMSSFNFSDEETKKLIDGLNVSADVKSLLYSFSKATIKAGEYIIKIGRKILDFVCMVFDEYPNATFGLLFGAIAGVLIGSIPILGVVLGPVFAPIAMLLGLTSGYFDDIKNKSLLRTIKAANAEFSPLNA